MSAMTVIVLVGVGATVWTLAEGIASMAQGGKYDQLHSNELMIRRVALQGVTFLFLLFALLLSQH